MVKQYFSDSGFELGTNNLSFLVLISRHPALVSLEKVTNVDGFCLVKSPYQGVTLKQFVTNTSLSESQMRSLFRQLASGIQFLHDHDVAHGNVRTDSIVVEAQVGATFQARLMASSSPLII